MQAVLKHIGLLMLIVLMGCAPNIKLITDARDRLNEYTLEGNGNDKILIIAIRGIISDTPKSDFWIEKPSIVQEVVSHLKKAEKDTDIKAIILKINSPGGTLTASDILYHEIKTFKERTHIKVIVSMMDMATSGGYYISLPADAIYAHPTTITGSVGVIFFRPKFDGLMDKIGVHVEVSKSGRNKDMGSPFRASNTEEETLFNKMIDQLGNQFVDLVVAHRRINPQQREKIATAEIFLPQEALELGLIDAIGYLSDSIAHAKKIAGLSDDAKVIVYRRDDYPDDNIYNTASAMNNGIKTAFMDFGWFSRLANLSPGPYYLWLPSVE